MLADAVWTEKVSVQCNDVGVVEKERVGMEGLDIVAPPELPRARASCHKLV